MKKVAIIDYGMCNLDSVARAIEECGGTPLVTDKKNDLELATHIILPGVGAFPDAMSEIIKRSLDKSLREQVLKKKIPFLGICLGMQLMATKGWEGEETDGLGLIEGEVKRFVPDSSDTRIPHVGWNEVNYTQKSPLFQEIPSGKDFYFVHSYHFCCQNEDDIIAHTPYCGGFVSAISRGHIFGAQFHPEKSQKPGFKVLKNFLSM
jgi:glutamine amidotransferase